jgi:hypothetical protein
VKVFVLSKCEICSNEYVVGGLELIRIGMSDLSLVSRLDVYYIVDQPGASCVTWGR